MSAADDDKAVAHGSKHFKSSVGNGNSGDVTDESGCLAVGGKHSMLIGGGHSQAGGGVGSLGGGGGDSSAAVVTGGGPPGGWGPSFYQPFHVYLAEQQAEKAAKAAADKEAKAARAAADMEAKAAEMAAQQAAQKSINRANKAAQEAARVALKAADRHCQEVPIEVITASTSAIVLPCLCLTATVDSPHLLCNEHCLANAINDKETTCLACLLVDCFVYCLSKGACTFLKICKVYISMQYEVRFWYRVDITISMLRPLCAGGCSDSSFAC